MTLFLFVVKKENFLLFFLSGGKTVFTTPLTRKLDTTSHYCASYLVFARKWGRDNAPEKKKGVTDPTAIKLREYKTPNEKEYFQ